jgi:hypothetical protein
MATRDFECRVRCLLPGPEMGAHGYACHLSGVEEGLVYGLVRLKKEIGTEALKIDGTWFNTMIERKVLEEGNGVKKCNSRVLRGGRRKKMRMGDAGLRDNEAFVVLHVTIVAILIKVVLEGDIGLFNAIKEVVIISVVGIIEDSTGPMVKGRS